jgi:YVTN family beta-propeller protein
VAPYRIYVTNESSGDVTVIDEPSHTVVATVALGKRPRGLQTSPDGRRLFVALSGSPVAPPGVDERTLPPPDKAADGIGVLDTQRLRLTRILRGVSNPEQLALSSTGKLYSASEDTDTLYVLDASSGAIVAGVKVGDEPEGVAVSPDGRLIYVTSEGENAVLAFDAARRSVTAHIPVGERPRSVAFAPDGAHAFVTGETNDSLSELDTAANKVVRVAKVPGEGARPMGVVVSPDGRRVYVTTGRGGQLVAFDTTRLTALGSVTVGDRPWGVAISPDGRFLYTANGPSNDIAVVDAEALSVVARIKSGGKPWGVVAAPK